MPDPVLHSDFLRYLLERAPQPGDRLPPLHEISQELGVSVGKLREQLEVARTLGLVDARPRRGIEYVGYSFAPAVRTSLLVALRLDRDLFQAFGDLRHHVELAFWDEAVSKLTEEDKSELLHLVARAQEKLQMPRIQIPHPEHRAFHLTIFRRLNNPFVLGLLEAYWDAYEAVEMDTYADYTYLTEVWRYHEQIAQALAAGQHDQARELHREHMSLLHARGVPGLVASQDGNGAAPPPGEDGGP